MIPHKARSPYPSFDLSYVWSAAGIALVGGFLFGSRIAWIMGTGGRLPDDFVTWIRVHGHLQLMGWCGLLIMGVSLYFIPRLIARPLTHAWAVSRIRWLLVVGLVGETLCRFSLAGDPAGYGMVVRAGVFVSVVLQAAAVVTYAWIILRMMMRNKTNTGGAVARFRPYLLSMVVGMILYSLVHLGLVPRPGIIRLNMLPSWVHWSVLLFMTWVLFPVIFVFSIQTFPLFLQTKPWKGHVRTAGWIYAFVNSIMTFSMMPCFTSHGVSEGLMLAWVLLTTWLVTRLGILPRIHLWNEGNEDVYHRKQLRNRQVIGFGHYDWLLLSAYGWLGVCLLGLAADVFGSLIRGMPAVPITVSRHAFLMGFATLMILGMAQRMVPGFLRRKQIAYPFIVTITAILANLATACRVVPFLVPPSLLRMIQWAPQCILYAFALSGWIAMLAVALMTWNLIRTTGFRPRADKRNP